MPTRHYADGAVEDLAAFLEANLAAQVTAVQAEVGYADPLIAPSAYRRGIHPTSVDPLSVEVEAPEDEFTDLHNGYTDVSCVVHLVLRATDADVVATQQRMRSYSTAVKKCINSDPSLGGKVVDAEIRRTTYSGIGTEGQLGTVASVEVMVHRED